MSRAPAARTAFTASTGEVDTALPASSSLATPHLSVYTSVDASSVYAASVISEPGVPSSIVCESPYNTGYASTGLPSDAPSPSRDRQPSPPEGANALSHPRRANIDLQQVVSAQQQ